VTVRQQIRHLGYALCRPVELRRIAAERLHVPYRRQVAA
jgi:hypothetical protein